MKIEAREAEGMPEMEAEFAFSFSTEELFVTRDAHSHRGDGKFWPYTLCLPLSL